jgi:hypothetical protein
MMRVPRPLSSPLPLGLPFTAEYHRTHNKHPRPLALPFRRPARTTTHTTIDGAPPAAPRPSLSIAVDDRLSPVSPLCAPQLSLFATTTASSDDDRLSPASPAIDAARISLSPKSPTPAAVASPAPPPASVRDEWVEAEAETDGEGAPAAERGAAEATAGTTCTEAEAAAAEISKLRTENESLTSQLVHLHTMLQEHMELVENAAAEISPAQREQSAEATASAKSWWDTFRSVQADEAVRETEKQAVKTAADAVRRAAETAADSAADGALATLGHPELAPPVERLIDANIETLEDEAVAYLDGLIDATAPPSSSATTATEADATAAAATDADDSACSASSTAQDTLWAATADAPTRTSSSSEPSASSSSSSGLLPDWSQLTARPTTKLGWAVRGAALGVSVAGLYAAGRYSQPHASSALATIRERLPSCPSLPLIGSNGGGGGGGAGGATAASSAASDLDSENLSLAPVLVSIGRKASAHIPGEGMPEMVKAGLGEAGHSF